MMEMLQTWAGHAAAWTGIALIALLCVVGLLLSCLTLSGTWLIVLAAVLASWWSGPEYPGWSLVAIFLGIAIAVELVEWFASAWGVQKRGGSKWAGFAALAGGIGGLFLGTAVIPVPIIGSLVGMTAGSFALAYAVEKHRLKVHDHALHIAWGTVTARVLVLFMKVGVTLGMIVWLAAGWIRQS
jgi:uncharacterized protein YqgC (DUF456 family)